LSLKSKKKNKQESWLSQPDGIEVEKGECSNEKYGYCEQQISVRMTCMTY
jgi:hypothetical protein